MSPQAKGRKEKSSGLEIEIRGLTLILINRRGGYQELDITPVFHFLKAFFKKDWKKDVKVKKCDCFKTGDIHKLDCQAENVNYLSLPSKGSAKKKLTK